MSYAVAWSEPNGKAYRGHAELGRHALTLSGRDHVGSVSRTLPYEDIRSFHIGRGEDGFDGRPALVLDHKRSSPWRVAPMAAIGSLQELAHALADRYAAQPHHPSGRQSTSGELFLNL
jgi:hypothetical protein